VTTTPVLVSPQDSEPFRIKADSSDFVSGAVLSQQLPGEEKWHSVVFYSKSLSPVEQNYEIHDKEMLAIICAVTPDSCLGNKSDIFHHNNKNNQLERRVWPPKDIH